MKTQRNVDFDLLRALIIFSALILHYNTNYHIGIIAIPSLVVQKYFFTVGWFFFFTAGYMAKKVYLDKFLINPKTVSYKLFKKGMMLLSVYIFYVFLMHIFTGTDLPDNAVSFVYDHSFFTKVLFTFSLLFLLTPGILFLYSRRNLLFWVLVLIVSFFVVYDKSQLPFTVPIKKCFFDRNLFLYPLIPSLFIYFGGFLFARYDSKQVVPTRHFIIILLILVIIHSFAIQSLATYSTLISDRNYFCIWELIFSIFFIFISRYVLFMLMNKKTHVSQYILCIGIYSLHFYVAGNTLIGLISITNESSPFFKLAGLLGVASLTYILTLWKSQAISEEK